jgi:hypothetical protein
MRARAHTRTRARAHTRICVHTHTQYFYTYNHTDSCRYAAKPAARGIHGRTRTV